jgi:8-oxo-dGTP pyrophosphatase MutT (NUDIX family)
VTTPEPTALAAASAEAAQSRRLHEDALATLTAWHAPGPAQDRLRRRFLGHLEDHADGMRRSCFPAHLTASTLVLSADHERVLLTLHAKAHRWFQFGGHCEPEDATLAGAALREAVEESGTARLALHPVPVHLDAHPVPFCSPRGTVHHLDVRFAAVAPDEAAHAVSEESVDVRWFPWSRLPTQDPGMLELVRLARESAG